MNRQLDDLLELDSSDSSRGWQQIQAASTQNGAGAVARGNSMDAAKLLTVVDEAVSAHQRRATRSDSGASRPVSSDLLGLLVYAYAQRILESDEIIDRCRTETAFRLLCNDCVPFHNELETFRRRNRDRLLQVLADVLANVDRLTGGERDEVGAFFQAEATLRLNTARHLDLC